MTDSQGLKVGLALATLGKQPINGLRHPPEGDTNGWYIWAGEELSRDEAFFEPVHVEHLSELLPQVLPFLSLAPGSRFLISEAQEETWFDASLLSVLSPHNARTRISLLLSSISSLSAQTSASARSGDRPGPS